MLNLPRLRKAHVWMSQALNFAIDTELQAAGRLGVQDARTSSEFKGAPKAGGLRAQSAFALMRLGKRRRVALSNRHPGAFAQDKGSGLFGPRRSKYPITARRARVLAFSVGGAMVFRRQVMHPGVHPTHFLFNANTRAFEHAGFLLNLKMIKLAKRFKRK